MYTPHFFPVTGGTEYATYYLSKELNKYCNVHIHTFNWVKTPANMQKIGINLSNGLPEVEFYDHLKVCRYPVTNLPIIKNFSLPLMNELLNSEYDIIHFQGLHRLFSRWSLQKVLKNKIKILTTHALYESIRIIKEKNLMRFLINSVYLDSLQNMDYIIALSESDVRILLSFGISKDKITVIPNGVNTNRFKKRKKYVDENSKLKILCVARFDKNKKYESIIYSMSRLKKDGINIEAYFIGQISDENYYNFILRLINKYDLDDDIKIGVSLDDPELIDCYLSCDLFVLPSSMETFPLVILEAMHAGLPIISTHVGGIPDIIKNGENGFLVDPNKPEQLYMRCKQLLLDDELRVHIGNRSKKIAKNYNWKEIAKKTYDLYRCVKQTQN
jgi:glycosyltransferase involved in cell wall biosynthesis